MGAVVTVRLKDLVSPQIEQEKEGRLLSEDRMWMERLLREEEARARGETLPPSNGEWMGGSLVLPDCRKKAAE